MEVTDVLSIIVGFPKMEDAISIRNILQRNGYSVEGLYTSAAQIISRANVLDGGIVICGYRFMDMHYSELKDYLPNGFEMLLLTSPNKLDICQDTNMVCLRMPIKTQELINTLEMMSHNYMRRKKKERENPKLRSDEDKNIIQKAKLLLMDRNNMTEEEAHRYIQKNSMDSGTNMVEMAQMILSIM